MTSRQRSEVLEIEGRLLGFVAGHQGSWSTESLKHLIWRLGKEGFVLDEAGLRTHLDRALARYHSGETHLFVCQGKPCRNFEPFELSQLADDARLSGCEVSTTACQGPCNHGPVATLRVGQRAAVLASFRQNEAVDSVVDYCARAAAEGTLLVDGGSATPYFHHDEDHDKGSNLLAPVAFLAGHYMGEGYSPSKGTRFIKEVRGSWEAGGRFIGLRMSATYGIGEDFKDTHSAFVMVGYNHAENRIESRGYTDGGEVILFPMSVADRVIRFPDRVPHHTNALRAEKSLEPTEGGYVETLMLDYADGSRHPYYIVRFKRVGPAVANA